MLGKGAWLIWFLVAQRLAELLYAHRNTVRLRHVGAVEYGQSHYYLIVALHAAWLATLWWLGRRHPIDAFWFSVFVVLLTGRLWAIESLGWRWTTRIIIVPGETLITRGPYRWVRHPNYIIVILEFAVVPLALGLPWVAVLFTPLNAAMLYWRIRVENAALASAATLANTQPRR